MPALFCSNGHQGAVAVASVATLLLAGCGATGAAPTSGRPTAPDHGSTTDVTTIHSPPPTTTAPTTTVPLTTSATTVPVTPSSVTPPTKGPPAATTAPAHLTTIPATAGGGPGRFPPTGAGPLTGKVVAIDPGHNGGNSSDPAYINQVVFNGRSGEACDTSGAETDSGYSEAMFNYNVAQDVVVDLRAAGATVVLTRTSNTGVGPCITERAAIGNEAGATVAVSIHADGGPASGRGFAILEPVADGPNNAIIGASQRLGVDLRAAFSNRTGEPISSYDGTDGIAPRNDLAGTNLSTVPKVFIECANMRNATDAALVTSGAWQALAAQGIADGLTAFVTGT